MVGVRHEARAAEPGRKPGLIVKLAGTKNLCHEKSDVCRFSRANFGSALGERTIFRLSQTREKL